MIVNSLWAALGILALAIVAEIDFSLSMRRQRKGVEPESRDSSRDAALREAFEEFETRVSTLLNGKQL
jgi:hypothetical protein